MIVTGKNVRVLIYDNGGYRLYACATSCTITLTTSVIETSTTGSGVFATFKPQKHTWICTLEGAVNLDEPGSLTLADLRSKQLSFTELLISYERTDDDGNTYADSGTAIIISSTDTGDVNDIATFSIELQGTGTLTQSFTPSTLALSAVRRYEYTATGGETELTDASLIGKDILEFTKDGVGFSKILTSGTPVSKQVVYTSLTGKFEWLIPAEPGEEIYITYQDII